MYELMSGVFSVLALAMQIRNQMRCSVTDCQGTSPIVYLLYVHGGVVFHRSPVMKFVLLSEGLE